MGHGVLCCIFAASDDGVLAQQLGGHDLCICMPCFILWPEWGREVFVCIEDRKKTGGDIPIVPCTQAPASLHFFGCPVHKRG